MKNLAWSMLKWSSRAIILSLFLISCEGCEEVHELPSKSTDLVIADYIDSRPDLSEMAKILERIPTEIGRAHV